MTARKSVRAVGYSLARGRLSDAPPYVCCTDLSGSPKPCTHRRPSEPLDARTLRAKAYRTAARALNAMAQDDRLRGEYIEAVGIETAVRKLRAMARKIERTKR